MCVYVCVLERWGREGGREGERQRDRENPLVLDIELYVKSNM